MNLVMTLLVRDEEDILEANLTYHLSQGVDFIIVTDNLSEDSTPAILRRHEAAGSVRVIEEHDDDYSQAKWVTRMARLACLEHAADWVINADADEFWWPLQGNLKSSLEALPPEVGLVHAPRRDFVPVPDDGRPFYERMTVRETLSVNALGNPLPPKVAHRAHPEVTVWQGNHHARAPGLDPFEGDPLITIHHFPMRTYRQFENKIVKGGLAYRRNVDVHPTTGATWRHLFDLYEAGGLPTHYQEQEWSAEAIEAGVASGELVRDDRLVRTLEKVL